MSGGSLFISVFETAPWLIVCPQYSFLATWRFIYIFQEKIMFDYKLTSVFR